MKKGEVRFVDFSRKLRRQLALSGRFTGRAARAEFWQLVLYTLLAVGLAVLCDAVVFGDLTIAFIGPITTLVLVAMLQPLLAVSVRRLHDVGRSGLWMLVGLVPVLGILLLLVWFLTESEARTNRHGRDPLDTR